MFGLSGDRFFSYSRELDQWNRLLICSHSVSASRSFCLLYSSLSFCISCIAFFLSLSEFSVSCISFSTSSFIICYCPETMFRIAPNELLTSSWRISSPMPFYSYSLNWTLGFEAGWSSYIYYLRKSCLRVREVGGSVCNSLMRAGLIEMLFVLLLIVNEFS